MSGDSVKTGPLELVHDEDGAGLDPLTRIERLFVDRGHLGSGVGEVRRVLDPRLLRETALKHLRPDEVHPSLVHRFAEEARIAGQLEHPNVVPVYEVGPDGSGGVYATLKLVEGETLADRIEALGSHRLDPDKLGDLVGLLLRVCDALAYAHSRGVFHCDLKPENILLGAFGQTYVADWGAAHVADRSDIAVWSDAGRTADRSPGGTPAWLSPEQARGEAEQIGPHTDVFGVGALLYGILCGQPLYGDSPLAEAVHRAATGAYDPIPADVRERAPKRLVDLCEQALARQPARRHADILTLQRELEQFLRGTWAMPRVEFPAGAKVVEEGEHGGCAYVVQRGELIVYTDRDGTRLDLRTLGPGDVFGEMAVLGDGARTATVEAISDVALLQVSGSALEDGLGLNGWLGRFVTGLAHRFREADDTLREVRLSMIPRATRAGDD